MSNDTSIPELETFKKHQYGVIYLDFLGQKDLMRNAEKDDASLEDRQKYQKVLQHINNFVSEIHHFQDVFSPQNTKTLYDIIFVKNDNIRRDEITEEDLRKSLENFSLGIEQFSDSTLLYARLDGEHPYLSKIVFGSLILRLPEILLNLYSHGIFLRGAITVGEAREINKNNLYGLVIHEAYELEEKVAQWSRIVLSQSAVKFFQDDIDDIYNKYSNEEGICCCCKIAENILEDFDGIPYLTLFSKITLLNAANNYKTNNDEMGRKIITQIIEICKILDKNINQYSKKINTSLEEEMNNSSSKKIKNPLPSKIAEYSKRILRYKMLKNEFLSATLLFYKYCERYGVVNKKDVQELGMWYDNEASRNMGVFTPKSTILKLPPIM